METGWWRKAVGEAIGAFGLVVVGAGSVLASNGNQLYAALGHGFVIAVMGTALGPISGGQISPAVTLGLLVTRRQKADLSFMIIVFQLIGSIFGGLVLLSYYPLVAGTPQAAIHLATPAVNRTITATQGALLETLMTFFLVFVVFATAIDSRGAAKTLGALPIGLTVAIDWLIGGGFTGAAMSPGRWIGPAMASGVLDNWWVYWVGPLLGGVLAALVYEYAFMPRKK